VSERGIALTNPIALSPEQLYRELTALREIIETRLDAIDRATEIFQQNLTRVPTDVDKQISQLKELHEVKFEHVQSQFASRDVAVNAAFAAAKEAVAAQNLASAAAILKAETATGKELDGVKALIFTSGQAQDDKISTINARLDRGDGATTKGSQSLNTTLVVIMIIATVVSGIVGAIMANSLHAASTVIAVPAK
jgi:hypothetical protein